MIKKIVVFLVILIMFAGVFYKTYSDDKTPGKTVYVNSTYRLQNKLFKSYMVSEYHKFKLSSPDSLGNLLFDNSPESKKLLMRARVANAIGLTSVLVGGLSAIYSPTVAMHYEGRIPLPGILLTGGAAMLVIAIPIECRAANLKSKFLWIFNRDAISTLSGSIKNSEESR